MKYPRYFALIPYILLLLFWGYTFYAGVVDAPYGGYYTIDESYVADGGVFLYYGITPRCLDWPAAPGILLFYLLFTLTTIWNLVGQLTTYAGFVDVLNQFDWNAYSYLINREPFIIAGRVVQLVLVLLIVILTVRFLLRSDSVKKEQVGLILSLLIVSSYMVWSNAPCLRPEALAGTLFLYILVRLIWTERISKKDVYFLSALFAVVIAQRLLFAFLFPAFLLGIFFQSSKEHRMNYSLKAMGMIVVFFMALCPFFLTAPMVVAKAFFGGILAKMNDKPMETFFNQVYISGIFDHYLNFIVLAIVLVGAVVFVSQRKIFYTAIVINWLLFLFLVLRSPKIYDTHVLPAGVITLVMLAYGLNFLLVRFGNYGRILVVILLVAFVADNGYRYVDFQIMSHKETNEEGFYKWLSANADSSTTLLLPIEVDMKLPKGKETLLREMEQRRDKSKMIRKLNYLLGRKGEEQIAADRLPLIAWNNVFEDEKMYELQYELLLKYANGRNKGYNYTVYLDNVELVSHGITVKKALEDFEDGKYYFLVTEEVLPEPAKPVVSFANKRGSAFYVYRRQTSL